MCSEEEEESTDLPFVAERSKRPNTRKPNGRHNVFFTIFPIIRLLNSSNRERERESERQTENEIVRCCQFTTGIASLEQMNNGVRLSGVGATQRVTAITRVLPPPTFAQLRTKVQCHTSTLWTTTLNTCSSSHLRIILSPPDRRLMNPVDVSKLVHGTTYMQNAQRDQGQFTETCFVRNEGPWTCQFRVARCSGASQKHTEHTSRAAVGQQCKPCGFIGQGWRLTRHRILLSAR